MMRRTSASIRPIFGGQLPLIQPNFPELRAAREQGLRERFAAFTVFEEQHAAPGDLYSLSASISSAAVKWLAGTERGGTPSHAAQPSASAPADRRYARSDVTSSACRPNSCASIEQQRDRRHQS